MNRQNALLAGALLLIAAWVGPLPDLAGESFTAHMALHLIIITVAAPLIAIGLGGTRIEYALLAVGLLNPIFASLVELIVVWAWHAPALHAISRADKLFFGFEQLSFLLAGILLWLSAFGRAGDTVRAGAGVVALLMTSMHMTLLGALLVLSRRPFYAHHGAHGNGPAALVDQQIGGLLMLGVGGSVYLAAGLWLLVRILRSKRDRKESMPKELHRLTQVQP